MLQVNVNTIVVVSPGQTWLINTTVMTSVRQQDCHHINTNVIVSAWL